MPFLFEWSVAISSGWLAVYLCNWFSQINNPTDQKSEWAVTLCCSSEKSMKFYIIIRYFVWKMIDWLHLWLWSDRYGTGTADHLYFGLFVSHKTICERWGWIHEFVFDFNRSRLMRLLQFFRLIINCIIPFPSNSLNFKCLRSPVMGEFSHLVLKYLISCISAL